MIFQIINSILNFIKNGYTLLNNNIPHFKLFLIIGAFLIIIFFVIRELQNFLRFINKTFGQFKTKTYRVVIPKNIKDDDPNAKRDIKTIIASFESFFYNMAGIDPDIKKGFFADTKNYIHPRQDHFAMEIINDNDDLISFYFTVPIKLNDLLKQQLNGVWPDAFIEEVGDYNIFTPNNTSIAATLKLKKLYALPILTYQKFENDPLDILLNALSKFTNGDNVVVQILARSSESKWRATSDKVISYLNKGEKINSAIKKAETPNFALAKIGRAIANFITLANGGDLKKDELKTSQDIEVAEKIKEKMSKPGMDVNIRILVTSKEKDKRYIKRKLQNILDCFYQYNDFNLLNGFEARIVKSTSEQNHLIKKIIFRNFDEDNTNKMILNSEELITIFHLPLPTSDVANIRWLLARTAPATFKCVAPEKGITIGYNEYRGEKQDIVVSNEDRMRHMYIIGKSGTGKTNILKDMAIQDAINGNGFCIIDPHGDFAENVLSYIPKERAEDVIYFDPSDLERPIGLNLYEFDTTRPEQKTLVVNQFIEMLYTMYDKEQIGGPMFEYYTKNALLLNMEDPESGNTMIEIPKVMAQDDFRHMKLDRCKDPIVKDFWIKEAEKAGGDASLANIVPYITSKLNQFIVNEFMRNIIGQQKSTIDFAEIMNTKKILICNFSKGKIGDMNSQLLGLIVVGRILISALERAALPNDKRYPFFLYIDECQNFLTPAITTILAEARKYGLGLVLANQFITQLVKGNDTTIKDGIFGNAGTISAYRISTEDAEFMEKIMEPTFSRSDLENSPSGIACCKTLVNNTATKPFTLTARKYWELYGDPNSPKLLEKANYIKELSRLKYGRSKDEVNKEIMQRLGFGGLNDKEQLENELSKLFGE